MKGVMLSVCLLCSMIVSARPQVDSLCALKPVRPGTQANEYISTNGKMHGRNFTVNGKQYTNFVYAHAPSSLVYDLTGKGYMTFKGKVSLEDNYHGYVSFKIFGDGKELWKSRKVYHKKGKMIEYDFSLSVRNVKKLRLVADHLDEGYCDHSVWLEPTFSWSDESRKRAEQELAKSKKVKESKEDGKPTYLTDFKPKVIKQGWGGFQSLSDGTRRGVPVLFARKPKKSLLYVHPPSQIEYDISGKGYKFLKGYASLADEFRGKVQFFVYGDGKPLWKSKPVYRHKTRSRAKQDFYKVNIANVKKLELRVKALNDGFDGHAYWIEPTLLKK